MIELSVGLPFFRSKYIGWAALESLCLQENINFEWELIIMEEVNDPEALGKDEIKKYENRLKAVGCKHLRYTPFKKWVPLAVKLKKLINSFSDSEVAIWNPDDYYAPPKLLSTAYEVLSNDISIDWFSIPKTIFYNISDEKTLVYDVWTTKHRRKDDSTGRAFRTSMLKGATEYFDQRKAVCDGMIRDAYKKVLNRPIVMHFDDTDNWKRGLNIKGLNNVSKGQERWFYNIKPPLYRCEVVLKEFIPEHVLKKLIECKKYLKLHKRGVGK